MAVGTIRISPEVMRTRAASYANEAENLQGIIGRMDTLLGQLQEEWEGDASKAYAERYTELKPGFEKAKVLVDEIANALRTIATDMENTDSTIGSRLRG